VVVGPIRREKRSGLAVLNKKMPPQFFLATLALPDKIGATLGELE